MVHASICGFSESMLKGCSTEHALPCACTMPLVLGRLLLQYEELAQKENVLKDVAASDIKMAESTRASLKATH